MCVKNAEKISFMIQFTYITRFKNNHTFRYTYIGNKESDLKKTQHQNQSIRKGVMMSQTDTHS